MTTRMLILPSETGRLFGRHVEHDPRSWDYKDRGAPRKLVSVRHERHAPIFEQGDIGSCTGNAILGVLGTSPYWENLPPNYVLEESLAVRLYSIATRSDGIPGTYPPDDTGSSGNAVARAARSLGLIAGWSWCFSASTVLRRLTTGPLAIGIAWREGMMNPASNGVIKATGPVVGGHEVCLDEIDVEKERVGIANSWSDTWGVQGRAYLSWADLTTLLTDHGDATVLVSK